MPGVLTDVIRRAPLTAEKVTLAWRLAVGPALARATTVRFDEHGTLHVSASGPAWMAAVKSAEALIRSRLTTTLGDVVRRMEFDSGVRNQRSGAGSPSRD